MSLRRRIIPALLVLMGLAGAVSAVLSLDRITFHINGRDPETILGAFTIMSLVCFDYAFAVGFRSGTLGYSMADVNFCFAGPFGHKHNLLLSFTYGGASVIFFLFLLCLNSPLLAIWIGVTTADMLVFLLTAFLTSLAAFLITSLYNARFCDNTPAKIAAVAGLLLTHAVAGGLILRDLIGKFGSMEIVRQQPPDVLTEQIGNSLWLDLYPVTGWNMAALKAFVRGTSGIMPVCIALYILVMGLTVFMYFKVKLDFYEHAGDNAQKIKDIVEASKAGVESVNTGIARTAKVGNEVFRHGWGADTFFHIHLFENRRASKVFFVNKVALVYRVFAFLILLIADGILSEDMDVVVVIAGITTMLVLNAIVFGGSKTILEFNRPYLYVVPEKSGTKLSMCILSDVPEMVFDAVVCTLMIKFVASSVFTAVPMISFVFLMVAFDLLSETVGIACARLLSGFGKFALMGVRYLLIIILIVAGMLPSEVAGGIVIADHMDDLPLVLTVMILSMAVTYFLLYLVFLSISKIIIDRTDA